MFRIAVVLALATLFALPAAAQVVSEDENTTVPGFNRIYVWASLSDPRNAVYTIPAGSSTASVPFQCQHMGEGTTNGAIQNIARTFTIRGRVGNRVSGTPTSMKEVKTTLTFDIGFNGTKQTPVLINDLGNVALSQGSYEAFGLTAMYESSDVTPPAECESKWPFIVSR